MTIAVWNLPDWERRVAGRWLERWLRVPDETPHQTLHLLRGCELLSYGGSGPPVLLVPAPIKRHYIWDLFPKASALRRLLDYGYAVYMLRWTDEAVDIGAGLDFYAATAPSAALRRIAGTGPHRPVVLAGHSLGGFFAAMAACLFPDRVRALILIESPLVFSGQRLGTAATAGPVLQPGLGRRITGTELSVLGSGLMPDEFLWHRWRDLMLLGGNPHRTRVHLGVTRWVLDESPLPARMLMELLGAISTDAFVLDRLTVAGETIGPAALKRPLLAVTCNSALTPPMSIEPFLARSEAKSRIIEFPIEEGTALGHVSPLVGPAALADLWPEIAAWIREADKAGSSP